ncbi:hypothetical protein R1sor_012561 [Riccia sorocarpa]|uniref:Uncharacterized protein n=1 Tax=Riccia sorocarpa TaxID=122646 RepID=A0ABD3I7R0_9MARC
MRRIPVKITYKVQEPYPEQLTLTQLIDISQPPEEFNLTEVCWWIGHIGIVPQQWSAELVDWFLPKLEYVSVGQLERGKQVAAGPFKYCRSSEWFLTLADADDKEISHPKYLKKKSETDCTYNTTAVCICSAHCLCKSAAEERRDLRVLCIYQVVFDRYSCNCQRIHQAEALEAEKVLGSIEAEKPDGSIEAADEKEFDRQEVDQTIEEAEDTELDQVLSQNFCICKNVFGDGNECYCGFKPAAKAKTASSDEGDGDQRHNDKRRKCSEGCDRKPQHRNMIRSGQYMPGLKWATMKPMSQLHVERIWQACVAPETITITDIDYILFGNSHNDRYFSSSHRMELLIAEPRKRKDDDDHKGQQADKAAEPDNDEEDGSKGNQREKAGHAHDGQQDRETPEPVRANDATVQQIHDRNENLQQPRAPGSPDDEFDADELPDVVNLDDIIQPGMDAEVLMYDLLAAGYGVRRRRPAGPEEHRNDDNNEQQQAANAAHDVIPANNDDGQQDEIPDYIPLVRPPT